MLKSDKVKNSIANGVGMKKKSSEIVVLKEFEKTQKDIQKINHRK